MIKVCPILISQKPVNITSGIHGQGRRLTRTKLGLPGTLIIYTSHKRRIIWIGRIIYFPGQSLTGIGGSESAVRELNHTLKHSCSLYPKDKKNDFLRDP